MKKFSGKKLLLLGTNVGTLDILKYARANGAYTIVADNLVREKSLGKRFSDEDVLISTGDFEALSQYVEQTGVDGIFAGVSEFNLLSAMKLCERFSLPFYCNKEQWDFIENKNLFRKMCIRYAVPCPKTYFSGSAVDLKKTTGVSFPCVVKPVDSCASRGVSICRTKDAFGNAVENAVKNSASGKIIVEEFFEGEEFTALYTISNGKVSLSCVDNRIPAKVHEGDVTTIPIARLYPSDFVNEYIACVNESVLRLCHSLMLETGVLFVQGLYNRNTKKFAIFEGGLRCPGEAPYRIIEKVNGINFMNNLVDYALLGHSLDFDLKKDDVHFSGKKAAVVSFASRGGKIGKICGFDFAQKNIRSVIDSECRYAEGDTVPDGNTLRQIVLRFVLVCNDFSQLKNDVERINKTVDIFDSDGNEMCVKPELNFDGGGYEGIVKFRRTLCPAYKVAA